MRRGVPILFTTARYWFQAVVSVWSVSAPCVRRLYVCVPGGIEERVFGPHQLADMHGYIAELVTQQAAQAHEGRRISHDLLCIGDDFTPAGRRRSGEQTQTPPSSPQRTQRAEESETGTHSHPETPEELGSISFSHTDTYRIKFPRPNTECELKIPLFHVC